MKKINISKFAAITLIAVSAVFGTGCTKDAKEEVAMPGEGTRVVISVGGINEGNGGSFNKIQASAGKTAAAQNGNGALIEGEAFDVLVSRPSSSASQLGFKDKIRAAATTADGLKADVPMTNGTAYRVFLRKQGTTILESAAFTSGTTGSIAVEKGATYEWFAVSYNSTVAVPEATGTDVVLSDINNLLYAKGEFAVGTGEGDVVVPLAIVFKPRVTKAQIEINTMGMFAPVASAEINVTGLYAAPEAIDVVTGDLTGGATSQSIAFGDFTPVAGSDGQRLVAEAFVAGNADENISVNVTNLSVTLDDASTRNFGAATLTQSFAPEAGMAQNIVLNFIESPLTFGTGATAVKWSRSNLYYRTDVMPSNPYRFNHTNTYSTVVDQNSYFSFKGHLPRRLGSATAANQKDPCALVYPAGLWKTPSQAEMAPLTNRSGVLGNLLGSIGDLLGVNPTPNAAVGPNYIQYTPTAGVNTAYGAATSGNNQIRFNYNGLQTNVGLVEGLITLNLANSKGTSAAFWTSQQAVSIPILGAGLGTWNYLGYTGDPLIGSDFPVGSSAASLLDIDLVGLNLVSSALMNVRCVRDANWNPAATGYNPYPDLAGL